jgi:hypothetical protein
MNRPDSDFANPYERDIADLEEQVNNLKRALTKSNDALKIYANSEHPYWVKKSEMVNGSMVHYIKNIVELGELARDILDMKGRIYE